jgi:thioredoxin 1
LPQFSAFSSQPSPCFSPFPLSEWVEPGKIPLLKSLEKSRPAMCRAALDVSASSVQVPRMAQTFTDSNFQSEVLDSDLPVLVDFWAEWCGPCKMIGPVIDQVAADLEGTAKVGKVNVDEARELAVKYNVRSIPYLLFFKNGEVKDQIVGASVTKDQLKAKLMALA